jgi:hypothetical protein
MALAAGDQRDDDKWMTVGCAIHFGRHVTDQLNHNIE